MKISFNYETLLANLQLISNIVEDPLSSEDDRSVLFNVTDGVLKMLGVSPVITYKKTVASDKYKLIDGDNFSFVIKSRELINFLSTFKTLRRTAVESVTFESNSTKIKCIVTEYRKYTKEETEKIEQEIAWGSSKDPRDERFHSSWVFDNIPIQPRKKAFIELQAPEMELYSETENKEFTLLSESVIPIVIDSPTIYGYLTFTDKYIVAFNQAYTTIMKNFLIGDTFTNIRLSYRTLSFIGKIITNSEGIQYGKTDRHIYFKTDDSESFIIYDTKLTPFEKQLSLFSDEKRLSVDRIYLKDIIKRFSLINDVMELSINPTDRKITLSNKKLVQELPILSDINFDDNISFKLTPTVLDNAIIGKDSTFMVADNPDSTETYIYYNQDKKTICFGDHTGIWFSIIAVIVN